MRYREVAEITDLMELHLGYEVSLFGDLYLRELEDCRFAVGFQSKLGSEELFEDLPHAVDRFLCLRHEHKLGVDYEKGRV
jgi:hypothetical protein